MSKPKPVSQTFTTDWDTSIAWAQSKGIPASSYIPVYQQDAARLEAGEQIMSPAERNIAILAAHNPNDVPSASSDNPRPSNVFGNARSDLASIVTGLEPTHLVSGLYDTMKNTAEAITDPEKEQGANLGITAANWLQNTLLSFVPGAYDIGTVLRADPNLSGNEGFKALAEHPLMSLLDVLPDVGGVGDVLAKTGMGARLADAAGMSTEQVAKGGIAKALTSALSNRTWGVGKGIDPSSAAEGIRDQTIGGQIQTWLGKTKLGTSAPIQNFVREYMVGNQLATGIMSSVMTPTLDALSDLSQPELDQYNAIFRANQTQGKNIQDLLKEPSVSEKVRTAVKTTLNGPIRFETEEAIASQDVVGVRRPDGTVGLYSSTGALAKKVIDARDWLSNSRKDFLDRLDPTDKLVKSVNRLDASQGQLADVLSNLNQKAALAIPKDDDLLENVKQAYRPPGTTKLGKEKPEETLTFGQKRTQANKVFGPSGLVEQLVDAMKNGKDDQIATLLPVLDHRLSEWGVHSVDATSNPAFAAVAKEVKTLHQLSKNRKIMNDEIDKRIVGEGKQVSRETVEDRAQRAAERREQAVRQSAERKQLKDDGKLDVERINAARKANLKNINDTYEHMKDAALVKGDQAAERATKAQADEIYRTVKMDLAQLRQSWWKLKHQANDKYDRQVAESKLASEKAKVPLAKRHEKEAADLSAHHANMKMFHGALADEMRTYTDALSDFHQAVHDNPTDDYNSMELELFQRHLMTHQKNAELLDATEKNLREKSGWEQSRVDALHQNPALLREQVWLMARDIYLHPSNFEPDLADAAKQAMDDVTKSGLDELEKLRAEGYRPEWVPRASTFDRISSRIKAAPGKGVPHVDVAHERIRDLTATRHDVVLGVNKAMSQALRRDATIDFVENSIVPRAITGSKLEAQLKSLPGWENLDLSIGTSLDAHSAALAKFGLTRFDPNSIFEGFSLPRWEGEAVYLPSGLATALSKTMEMERKGDGSFFDKSNQVFRYSILGLSPRYTAHIMFGGTFLLALRSTPYMPSMLVKAVRAMKSGDIPESVFRQPAQEGFGRFQYALQEHAFASGSQLANMAVGEHIEKVQGVLLHKASPFHYLKAMADVNFRFTRYMTRMQTAVAYMDYFSSAERRGSFLDESTGQVVKMTKERAMQEGMHHVLEVFGDLRSMSPFERQVAKNIMPFYGWTRHILKYTLTMPADHPWRAMVLSLIAFENSEAVPKGLPERIQFLFFLGSPDSQGNVSAIDTRFMDPLRDVANYASLGGWIQGLNPVFLAPAAMMDPQLVYGSTSLYPNLTYNDMYGIETAGAQGSALSGLEQFIPQTGALSDAMSVAGNTRELATNPNAFYKSVFNDLNIPFAQVQKINVKQIAAKDAIARYQVAKQAAANAFQTGDFSTLSGYATVPNPLNSDYEISPQELAAVYNAALAQYPGQAPINVLTPPVAPPGY